MTTDEIKQSIRDEIFNDWDFYTMLSRLDAQHQNCFSEMVNNLEFKALQSHPDSTEIICPKSDGKTAEIMSSFIEVNDKQYGQGYFCTSDVLEEIQQTLSSKSVCKEKNMNLFPRANEEQRTAGWTYDTSYLEKVRNSVKEKCDDEPSEETIESVLIFLDQELQERGNGRVEDHHCTDKQCNLANNFAEELITAFENQALTELQDAFLHNPPTLSYEKARKILWKK